MLDSSKIKIGLHLKLKQVLSKLFNPWSNKLLGSTTSKVPKNENGKNLL